MQFFLWQFREYSLPTRSVLCDRNINTTCTCESCRVHYETYLHRFITCESLQAVLRGCSVATDMIPFSNDFDLFEWARDMVSKNETFSIFFLWKYWCLRVREFQQQLWWGMSGVCSTILCTHLMVLGIAG